MAAMAAPQLIPHMKPNKMKKDEHGLSFLLLAHLLQGQQLLKNAVGDHYGVTTVVAKAEETKGWQMRS